MILTQLPDLAPRPETPRNAPFRRHFYARWGKENCIVSGWSRHAEYATYRQTLSIKMVEGGSEHYFLNRRRITVSDQTYLVLNEGRAYASLLEAPREAYSFALFFKPALIGEVARASGLTLSEALDSGPCIGSAPVEFMESVRRHDHVVSPVLRYIRRHVELGVDDQAWYDEQFDFLAERLLRGEEKISSSAERIDCVRPGKRKELLKRVGWAVDYAHSNLSEDIKLGNLADAAHLSQYHFLRLFRAVHGVTPMAYLRQQRTARALALIESTNMPIADIAAQVGLSRLALWRSLRRSIGRGPDGVRRRRRLDTPPLVGCGFDAASPESVDSSRD